MRQMVGILGADGLVAPDGTVISRPAPAPEPRAVVVQEPPTRRNVAPLDPLDEYRAHIAAALKLARDMSGDDKRAASNIMEAARGVLTATTYLDSNEQRRFEQ